MRDMLRRFRASLDFPLVTKSRLTILLAALVIIPGLFLPLWKLEFTSQQYPEGLELYIYSNKLYGGDDGNDLTEINVLNHYIGMAELREEDFTEFKWIPLVVSIMVVLTLRAAAIGTLKTLLDIFVSTVYFGGFSLWRFWYMLHSYGHNLDPRAAVKVAPFTPPLFGTKLVGQFTVTSYPASGMYFFILFGVLVLLGIYFTYKTAIRLMPVKPA